MLDNTCIEFSNQLSSKAAVPGGGGACAYAGAMGIALGNMVGYLTVGKKKYADVQDDIQRLLEEGEKIREEFHGLVQKDADAFYPLSQAYGLPKATEEEKAAKAAALQEALVDATLVPLEIMKVCHRAIELHEEMGRIGTRIALSDVGVGVLFCKAALRGAYLNVLINLNLLKDEDLKARVEAESAQYLKEGEALAEEVYQLVQEALK